MARDGAGRRSFQRFRPRRVHRSRTRAIRRYASRIRQIAGGDPFPFRSRVSLRDAESRSGGGAPRRRGSGLMSYLAMEAEAVRLKRLRVHEREREAAKARAMADTSP